MIEARQRATLLIIPANKLDEAYAASLPGLSANLEQFSAPGTYNFRYVAGGFQLDNGLWVSLPPSVLPLLLGSEGDSTNPGTTDEYNTLDFLQAANRQFEDYSIIGGESGTPVLIWYGSQYATVNITRISPSGLVYQFVGYTP